MKPSVTPLLGMNTQVSPATGQVSTKLGGEVAILHLESGRYYMLDEVGARVWELLQEPRTVGDLLGTLLEEYEVQPEPCEHDLNTLLRSLAERGVVELASPRAE